MHRFRADNRSSARIALLQDDFDRAETIRQATFTVSFPALVAERQQPAYVDSR